MHLTRNISIVVRSSELCEITWKNKLISCHLFQICRRAYSLLSHTTNWVLLDNYFHALVLIIFNFHAPISWIIFFKGLLCSHSSLDYRKISRLSKIPRPCKTLVCPSNWPFYLHIKAMFYKCPFTKVENCLSESARSRSFLFLGSRWSSIPGNWVENACPYLRNSANELKHLTALVWRLPQKWSKGEASPWKAPARLAVAYG